MLKLRFVPAELPGAQYRAGLAGLCYVARKHVREDGEAVIFSASREELRALFARLYEAFLVEPKNGGRPYPKPTGSFRPDDPDGPWRALWRRGMNMFRSNESPASLGIYKGDGPIEAADDLWEAIRTRKLVGISGSLMLGAKGMDPNTKKLVKVSAEHALLLHFQQVVLDFYILRRREAKDRLSYEMIAVVPDVEHPVEFAEMWATVGRRQEALPPEQMFGDVPAHALVDVPREAALAEVVGQSRAYSALTAPVYAYELYVDGVNERYMPPRRTLEAYRHFREAGIRSCELRALMVENILRGKAPLRDFNRLVSRLPIREVCMLRGDLGKWRYTDIAAPHAAPEENVSDEKTSNEKTTREPETDPWKLVQRVVSAHLYARSSERAPNEKDRKEYLGREAREFLLAVRGKRGPAARRAIERRLYSTKLNLFDTEHATFAAAAQSDDFSSMVLCAVACYLPSS